MRVRTDNPPPLVGPPRVVRRVSRQIAHPPEVLTHGCCAVWTAPIQVTICLIILLVQVRAWRARRDNHYHIAPSPPCSLDFAMSLSANECALHCVCACVLRTFVARAVRAGGLLALPADHPDPGARDVLPVPHGQEVAQVDGPPREDHPRGPRCVCPRHLCLSEYNTYVMPRRRCDACGEVLLLRAAVLEA